MERQKRTEIIENSGNYLINSPEFSKGQFGKTNDTINRIVHSVNIDAKALEEAVYQISCFNAAEKEEACFTEEGKKRYDRFIEDTRESAERYRKLVEALRRSERLTWRDYAIVINV